MDFSWKHAEGVWNVMLTPFTTEGKVDWDAFTELVEFYITADIKGIFVNSRTSEVFSLTKEEQIEIARRAVDLVHGRIGVVSGGNFGNTLEEQGRSMQIYTDMGIDATVVLLSVLPNPEHLDQQLLKLEKMVGGPLGIYEVPFPEHRLLNADEVNVLAKNGHFVFFKETSRKVPTYLAKSRIAYKSPMWVFQANLKCMWESIQGGGVGFCGVMANVCPELCNVVCNLRNDLLLRTRANNALLTLNQLTDTTIHPVPSKYILQKRGIHMTTKSRMADDSEFISEMKYALDCLLETFDFLNPGEKYNTINDQFSNQSKSNNNVHNID